MALEKILRNAGYAFFAGIGCWMGVHTAMESYTTEYIKPIPIYAERKCTDLRIERMYNGLYHATIAQNGIIIEEKYFVAPKPPVPQAPQPPKIEAKEDL